MIPHGFGQEPQVVELACSFQPLAAINHHTLAVNVFRHIADQKGGEVGEFLRVYQTASWDFC